MNPDDELLLKGLGQAAREQHREDQLIDDRWDALAAGALSVDEVRELESMADESPEAAELLEAFRPLDEQFQGRLLKRIETELITADKASASTSLQDNVVEFKKRKRLKSVLFTLSATAAAAAALALLVLVVGGKTAPLSHYSLLLEGQVRTTRGQNDEPLKGETKRFTGGSRLTITLRPERATEGPVSTRLFFEGADSIQSPKLPTEIDEQGAVRIRAVVGRELNLPAGDWTVWIVLGHEEDLRAMNSSDPKLALKDARANSNLRVLSTPLRIEK